MSKTHQIELDKITTEGLQTRAAINRARVKEYAAAERDQGAVFPPVTLFLGPDGLYRLADGFHRLEVARRLGRKTIGAEVREGGFIDALKCALLANAAHGLRRTAADKRNAVMIAYKYRLELGLGEVPSARAVSEKVGVSHIVAGHQLDTVPSWRDAQARTGADGRTRSLRSSVLSHPSSVPQPPAPLDRRGRDVPPALQPLWNRGAEVRELCTLVNQVKTVLGYGWYKYDPLWRGMAHPYLQELAINLLKKIKVAEPYCVCPMCRGRGCKICSGRGLIGERTYIYDVPDVLK